MAGINDWNNKYMRVKFTKMHGLGNDFVILDKEAIENNLPTKDFIKAISNRFTGIGCDQLIVYQNISQNIYEMLIYNQDGSKAKLCGNVARCLTKLLYLKSGKKDFVLQVVDKDLKCSVNPQDTISVNIGIPNFSASWMPMPEKIWQFAQNYAIEPKDMLCVDVGNPHLVIFTNLSDLDKDVIANNLEKSSLFEDGVNVNFASIKDEKIYLSVWERGVGLTLACGSGACATFAGAEKLGFTKPPTEVVFSLGSLFMSKKDDEIIMTGPASFVAEGEYYYEQ